ncbi:hypothetical protein GQ53DRAFT_747540 [Thozetella sp. PMI_491]|nr:hypothetical protein GQ53DRAFT_747540 [Thozetella sp. PMI_491]
MIAILLLRLFLLFGCLPVLSVTSPVLSDLNERNLSTIALDGAPPLSERYGWAPGPYYADPNYLSPYVTTPNVG